jgi:hypothetical protein
MTLLQFEQKLAGTGAIDAHVFALCYRMNFARDGVAFPPEQPEEAWYGAFEAWKRFKNEASKLLR